MKDVKVKLYLYLMKHKIHVNKDLKESLKESFTNKKSFSFPPIKKWATALVLMAAAITTFILFAGTSKVSAESLNVESYLSLASLGGGRSLSVSEHNGTAYINMYGEGLFSYNEKGFNKLYEGQMNSAKISRDGKKIIFSEQGSIKIYDLTTNKVNELLTGDARTSYFEPSWLADNHSILYTMEYAANPESEENKMVTSAVYKMDLVTMSPQKVGDGSYASFVYGKNAVVFQNRDGKIIYKSLEDNVEKVISDGAEPNVSPDGRYIVFTGFDISTTEIEKNVKIETGLQDIYIMDTDNLSIKKKVTNNLPLKTIDQDEWLKSITPSDEVQTLSYGGKYCYQHPAWSSDSKAIFAIKRTISDDPRKGDQASLIKITLDDSEPTGKNVVDQYLNAVLQGDSDFASTLVSPDFSDISSGEFSMAGYNLIDSGKENNKEYVDAECHYTNADNSVYRVEKVRYYLGLQLKAPMITDKKILDTSDVLIESNTVFMLKNGLKSAGLLSIPDIPQDYIADGNYSFGKIAYSPNKNILYFTARNGENSFKVFSYNISTKKVQLLDSVENSGDGVSAERLITDNTGNYAAFTYQLKNGENSKNISIIYSSGGNEKKILNNSFNQTLPDSINISCWSNDSLVFKVSAYGQWMSFKYLPSKDEAGAM